MPTYQQYFKKKIDRYSTPAWLDDLILVIRGNKQEHEKKLFDIPHKLENAGDRASNKNPISL